MKEMLKLMDKESDEHTCLTEALVSVEKVANYINEMQMISETYTPLFEKLCHRVGVEVNFDWSLVGIELEDGQEIQKHSKTK